MMINKTLVITPADPSLNFLFPIQEIIKKRFDNSKFVTPEPGKSVEVDDDVELIFFLGHGTNKDLFSSLTPEEEKTLFADVPNASRLFSGCSIIILACNSNEFIKNVKKNVSLDFYVGFGDMPTDWGHIKDIRKDKSNFLKTFDDNHLDFYKNVIVKSFIFGISQIQFANPSRTFFIGFKNSVNMFVREVLDNHTWNLETKIEMIDLLFDLKKEVIYN